LNPNPNSPASPRAEERRRNSRVRPSSLIFAQLGSGNGGIVVNLGMDGVACHAAQNVVAEKNSRLDVRLRGSGLNTEIVGELVWLGATRKEIGISFTNPSPEIRKEIADWMAREAQPADSAEIARKPIAKPSIDTPDSGVAETKIVSRSSSAALAAARAISAETSSAVKAVGGESPLPIPVDSAAILSSPTPQTEFLPLAEIISPHEDVPASVALTPRDYVENNLLEANPESFILQDGNPVEVVSHDAPPEEILATERADLSPVAGIYPAVHYEVAAPQPTEEPLQHLAEPKDKTEIVNTVEKTAARKSVARRTSFPLPRNSRPAILSEKWVPPALLDAWNRANPQRKKLLVHLGAACMGGILGLILIFGLTQIHSATPKPSSDATLQRPTTSATPSAAGDSTLSADPVSAAAPLSSPAVQSPPTAAPSTPASQANEPSDSPIVNFANSIFGSKPGGPPINDHQMGVLVWTIQSSGYYYCADDPYTKTGQPGTFQAQGDALQAGYRARLGQFCN